VQLQKKWRYQQLTCHSLLICLTFTAPHLQATATLLSRYELVVVVDTRSLFMYRARLAVVKTRTFSYTNKTHLTYKYMWLSYFTFLLHVACGLPLCAFLFHYNVVLTNVPHRLFMFKEMKIYVNDKVGFVKQQQMNASAVLGAVVKDTYFQTKEMADDITHVTRH